MGGGEGHARAISGSFLSLLVNAPLPDPMGILHLPAGSAIGLAVACPHHRCPGGTSGIMVAVTVHI